MTRPTPATLSGLMCRLSLNFRVRLPARFTTTSPKGSMCMVNQVSNQHNSNADAAADQDEGH